MEPTPIYTIHDLASETDVTARRIREWIAKRLVPPACGKRQDGINYTEPHLKRVILVRDWLENQVTLEEMAERIEILGEKALEVSPPYADFDGWEGYNSEQ